jgi:hypothetical protein
VINASSVTQSGAGLYKFTNCVVDGVPTSGGLDGNTQTFRTFRTSVIDGTPYGGLSWVGDDVSTNANGERASLKVTGRGTSGQSKFELMTASSSTGKITTYFMHGNGTPEGAVTAPVGSIYLNFAGGAGTTFYIKESGTGDTGWVGK